MKKRIILGAALAAVLAAPVALAQATTSVGSSILDALFTPTNVGVALGIIVGGVSLFAGGTWLTTQRKRRIALGAYHAFHVVEDIAAEDPADNGWDKAARGLQVIDAWLVAQGWRPLKPGEQELVKLEFKSLHGVQKAEEKVQEQALSVALGAVATKAALEATVPSMPRG
ncbi:MAG: hypothetical protein EOO71_17525 [Myxococcaceae bacterium]|nr:MAG: hypothetical protein EOO71_17525 [Myxococcaceae bacterium]